MRHRPVCTAIVFGGTAPTLRTSRPCRRESYEVVNILGLQTPPPCEPPKPSPHLHPHPYQRIKPLPIRLISVLFDVRAWYRTFCRIWLDLYPKESKNQTFLWCTRRTDALIRQNEGVSKRERGEGEREREKRTTELTRFWGSCSLWLVSALVVKTLIVVTFGLHILGLMLAHFYLPFQWLGRSVLRSSALII